MTTRTRLLSLALGLVLVLTGASLWSAPAFPYRLMAEPERPLSGESFTLSLEIEGLTGAVLGQVKASKGMDLGLSFSRPFVGKDGKARGSLLSLEFKISGPGPWDLLRLEAKGEEGSFVLGPLHIEPRAEASPSLSPGKRSMAWAWIAPDKVYRHASFAISLEPLPGIGTTPPAAQASFSPPEGGSLEALPGSALVWTATALDGSSLDLPQARIEAGQISGKAPPLRIEILPLPKEIEASRAMGELSLDLEAPPQAIVREGDSLVFRLILSGRGNLPSINLPKPRLTLNGANLASDLLSARRRDSVKAMPGGFEGSIILELVLEAPGPGSLDLFIPALTALLPSGEFTSLGPLSAEVRVLPRAGKAGSGSVDPFASRLGKLAKALSTQTGDLATLPALVAKARYAQALALLAAAPVPIKTSVEARTLEACLLWVKGERGRALAIVYSLSRHHEGGGDLASLSREAAELMGAGKPASKVLPRASLILIPVLVLSLAALGFLLAGIRAPRRGARKPLLKGAFGLCLLTALGLGLFAGASLLEDRAQYAVVWTDTLLPVPSALAEGREIVQKGSSARVMGSSPDYVGLRMEDGRVGWAPRDSVYPY